MVEYVNIVICRHPNVHKDFTFRAPDSSSKVLNVGDYVLCETCKGPNQIAQCMTPEFRIADYQLKEFYGITVDKLKPVTAYLKPIIFAYRRKEEEPHGEDGQQNQWITF